MPATTRKRARDASQSQSQSQSHQATPAPSGLLPSLLPPNSQNQESQFSFLSSSTAPLPRHHTVSVGLVPAARLDQKEQDELWIQGQEALSDAWRRLGEQEGRLDELIQRRRARLAGIGNHRAPKDDSAQVVHAGDALWYTAGLRYGCTCQLGKVGRGFSLKTKVPRLPSVAVEPLSPRSTALVPQVGPFVPDWAAPIDLSDLDKSLNELEEFELFPVPTSSFLHAEDTWLGRGQDDSGASTARIPAHAEGSRSQPHRRPTGKHPPRVIEEEPEASDAESSDSTVLFPSQHTHHPSGSLVDRVDRKGKSKALEPLPALIAPDPVPIPIHPSLAVSALDSVVDPAALAAQEAETLLAFSRERKAAWRNRIAQSGQYGRIWTTLSRPHMLESLPSAPDTTGARAMSSTQRQQQEPGEFVLPRFYTPSTGQSSALHPYHPDLAGYISEYPRARVHWIIPIHGPVIIPPHPLQPSSTLIMDPAVPYPLPSSGTLLEAPHNGIDPASPVAKSSPSHTLPPANGFIWTPVLLRHFWTAFLCSLHQSRLFGPGSGSLSVRLSGPKPDPWIDLPPAAPLKSHRGASVSSTAIDAGSTTYRPVRPETGDHIRLYIDARWALNLRLWLYGVTIDLDHPDLAGQVLPEKITAAVQRPARVAQAHAAQTAETKEVGKKGKLRADREGNKGAGKDGKRAPSSTITTKAAAAPVGQAGAGTWRPFVKQRLALIGEKGEVLIVA